MTESSVGAHLHEHTRGTRAPRNRDAASDAWSPEETRRFFVQFDHSLLREERERIQHDFRLVLEAYYPKYTYLENITIETLNRLVEHRDTQQQPHILDIYPFEPGDREFADIGKTEWQTEERQNLQRAGQYYLQAILFPEADLSNTVRRMEQYGANRPEGFDDRPGGGVARVEFFTDNLAAVKQIALIEGINWIDEVPETTADAGIPSGLLETGPARRTPITDRGLRGTNQIVGVIDIGSLALDHCWFRDPNHELPLPTNPNHRKIVAVYDQRGGVGTHADFVTGILAGDDVAAPGAAMIRGIACDAKIAYGNWSDFKGDGTPATLYQYLEKVALNGGHADLQACIVNTSWHSNGNPPYSQDAVDVDQFVWRYEERLIVGSSGNSGERLGPPGSAKNALCVAAAYVDDGQCLVGDGVAGPTADGQRRKPDLVSPGCDIESASAVGGCAIAADVKLFSQSVHRPVGLPANAYCAASFATPVVSAAAAIVRQYFVEGWYPSGRKQKADAFMPSAALLKAILLNSTAATASGGMPYPTDAEGWGLLQLDRILRLPGGTRRLQVWDVRNSSGLFTTDQVNLTVAIKRGRRPLKATLVWTEPPGQLGISTPVVNDLDLMVSGPGGVTYLGNVFRQGVSDPGDGVRQREPDPRNNVEMVLVRNPPPGDWQITIKATEVNVGNTGQGFALVVSGNLS